MSWQPINTVPACIEVLAARRDKDVVRHACVTYYPPSKRIRKDKNKYLAKYFQLSECGSYCEDSDLQFDPTHWMGFEELK